MFKNDHYTFSIAHLEHRGGLVLLGVQALLEDQGSPHLDLALL